MNEEVAEAVRQVQAAQQQTRDLQVWWIFVLILLSIFCVCGGSVWRSRFRFYLQLLFIHFIHFYSLSTLLLPGQAGRRNWGRFPLRDTHIYVTATAKGSTDWHGTRSGSPAWRDPTDGAQYRTDAHRSQVRHHFFHYDLVFSLFRLLLWPHLLLTQTLSRCCSLFPALFS